MIINFRDSRPAPSRRTSIRIEQIFDAWVLAAHDAREALHAWTRTDPRERAMAYTVYRAALDREEQAAGALRLAVVVI
jgi:hypothetical protein